MNDDRPPQLPPPAAPRSAGAHFLLAHPAHAIALGFGSGLAPKAPGTVGTLWAWLACVVLDGWFDPRQWGVVIAIAFVVGWWACTTAARHLGDADPGAIVWDEVLAFWIVMWLVTPAGFAAQLTAFVLFRFFDVAKPGPVAWADTVFAPKPDATGRLRIGWREGFGVLFDDLVAALCTLVVIALWRSG